MRKFFEQFNERQYASYVQEIANSLYNKFIE